MTLPSRDWRPPDAYVPGQTDRHPDGLFDPIRDTATTADLTALQDTLAWEMGLAFLSEGFFWEAHEVLEPVWLACPPNRPERHLVRGIIQVANARLKVRMGKPRAAARLFEIAERDIKEAFLDGASVRLGFERHQALALLDPDS